VCYEDEVRHAARPDACVELIRKQEEKETVHANNA
jgi:hypothetical protein